MKKIFKMMMAVVAGVAALTACTNNEPEEGITPAPENEYVIVKVSMNDNNRSLTDAKGIKWEVGDQIKYAGGVELTSEALTAEDIEADGYTANFKFAAALNEVNRTGWFSSTKNHPSNHNEVEFTLGAAGNNAYSQAVAGEMNSRYLFLHSGTGLINITKDEAPVVTMDIVGTIFRILPYTETYNDEVVESVELASKNNNGLVGTVAYDRGAGTYRGVNDINWQKYNFVQVSLTEPFALTNANSRENSKGIYMAIARTTETAPIEGYTYTVKTNVATYTFSSDENLVVGENELKNVYLKLENASSRVEMGSIKGSLKYEGSLNNFTAAPAGCSNQTVGYWYAMTKDTDATNYTKREGADHIAFYSGVVFECIDNQTNEAADWVTVRYNDGGNSEWKVTVAPQAEGGAERSATVTAIYSNVDGYILESGHATKSITVTQKAFTSTNTLGFAGGVGDQTLAGGEINNFDLGWCVIAVNGVNAESWGDDRNNEQALYGAVEIVCRDGAANGPVVDWLTVEYGKDANGKFNTTHLFANATENTTGADRRALVCCTYNAPEGYEFEGGAKSSFRQFMVTQKSNSSVKEISFWGGLASEYNHDASAQNAWGLSYWVVAVDGQNATDWNGDSLNEQAIYGGAEFKCYDFTNGVRGEEIDWVTVDYKNENGRYIDTWWLADIQANTGAARAAEIVCTFPEIEGYTYKDNQRVRTTIIRQAAGAGVEPENPEPENPGEATYTYDVATAGPAWGSGWGFPANTVHEGNYAFIRNAAKNGETIYFDGAAAPANAGEIAQMLVNMAFVSSEPTEEEKAAFGMQGKTSSATAIVARPRWYGGVQIDVAFTTTDANSITKVTGYAADGSVLGYWIIWTD